MLIRKSITPGMLAMACFWSISRMAPRNRKTTWIGSSPLPNSAFNLESLISLNLIYIYILYLFIYLLLFFIIYFYLFSFIFYFYLSIFIYLFIYLDTMALWIVGATLALGGLENSQLGGLQFQPPGSTVHLFEARVLFGAFGGNLQQHCTQVGDKATDFKNMPTPPT